MQSPFGERCGETGVGELVTDLHLKEITRFESYFLLTAAVFSRSYLVFLMPNSYTNHPEAIRTFQTMETLGWDLANMQEIPLNGYDNALVSTSLFVWRRETQSTGWSQAAIDRMHHPQHTLIPDAERVTKRGAHGPIEGYVWEGFADDVGWTRFSFNRIEPTSTIPFSWALEPQALGSIWQRLDSVYELTSTGWEWSNSNGYVEGMPVDPDFVIAQKAFTLYGPMTG